MKRITIVLAAASLFAVCGAGCRDTESNPAALSVVDITAPALSNTVHGATQALTLVHVWATWCPPCVHEFPDVVQLQESYRDADVNVLFVSADREEDLPAVRQFLAEQGVEGLTYRARNLNDSFIQTISPNWSGAIPASFFYGPEGTLLHEWEGAHSFANYQATVQRLLGDALMKQRKQP